MKKTKILLSHSLPNPFAKPVFRSILTLIFFSMTLISLGQTMLSASPTSTQEVSAKPKQASKPVEYPEEVIAVKNSITGKMILSHIDFLASRHCRGRETGEKGMDVASKYITSVLKGAELEAAGEFASYFQYVKLKKVSLALPIGNHLQIEEKIIGAALTKKAKLEWDFLPVNLSAEKEVTAPLVFAGYGITAPEHKYDDYKNLDVRGKIVLALRHEPGENDPQSPFEGRRMSKYGSLLTKILNAQKHGAVGILFVTDPLNHKELTASSVGGTYWPSLRKERYKDDEDYKFMSFSPRMRIVGADYGVKIPAVALDGKLVDYLLGEKHSLLRIQEGIDKNLTPNSFTIPGKRVDMAVNFKNEYVNAYNIVAKVVGSDPELKDEVVIVGGHYDHVGKDKRGRVYGGADDNASGTAGILELARAFRKLRQKPKRTVIFILFTAEEKGLLGARYYVENPLFPLEKTVAMINLDMIGRNDVEQMSLIGRYQYPKLYALIDKINKKTVNFDLNFAVEEFIRQSDHFPFMRKEVPTVFFNSGMHDELHRPEDTADLIIPEKAQKVTQLVFLSLWEVANLPPGASLK